MPPRLAGIYPPPRRVPELPTIFTARTLALPVLASVAALVLWAAGWDGAAIGAAAVTTVWAMQLVAPAVRQRSLSMQGWAAEVAFAAPFVLFFLPYLVWAAVVRPASGWSWVGVGIAIAVAAALQATEWRRLRPSFDRELLELLPPLRLATAVLRSYQTLAAAIGQEIFYRGVLYQLWGAALGWGVVPVSTALFVLEHMGNRWASAVFDLRYLCRITLLSAALATIAYATGSLWSAVLGHVAFNLVPVAQLACRYAVNPHRPEAPAQP